VNPYPALHDVLWSEFRNDHRQSHASTLIAPNGSLCCCTDYHLCGVMARHIVEMSL
jgi:hypothetical protein